MTTDKNKKVGVTCARCGVSFYTNVATDLCARCRFLVKIWIRKGDLRADQYVDQLPENNDWKERWAAPAAKRTGMRLAS